MGGLGHPYTYIPFLDHNHNSRESGNLLRSTYLAEYYNRPHGMYLKSLLPEKRTTTYPTMLSQKEHISLDASNRSRLFYKPVLENLSRTYPHRILLHNFRAPRRRQFPGTSSRPIPRVHRAHVLPRSYAAQLATRGVSVPVGIVALLRAGVDRPDGSGGAVELGGLLLCCYC